MWDYLKYIAKQEVIMKTAKIAKNNAGGMALINNWIRKALVGSALLTGFAEHNFADDALVIISPHRKSIQEELVPSFEEFYLKTYKTKVKVDWIDQGGTSDDVRFVKAKFEKNPKTSGIDLFWGGGSTTFTDLDADKLFEKLSLEKNITSEIPKDISGVPMISKGETWVGTAASSFGIIFNRKLIGFKQKLDARFVEPLVWEDLTKPALIGNVSLTDPRRSGSAAELNVIILKAYGFNKGWRILTQIAANARSFTHSSSDPIKAVANGDAAFGLTIDFYAYARIDSDGASNLGFVLPKDQTVLDPDPIAILRGAPNRKVADRFVNYVLSQEAQKKLILKKGEVGGPTRHYLGRMSVNKALYESLKANNSSIASPFSLGNYLKMDAEKTALERKVINDLIGTFHADMHADLVKVWNKRTDGGKKQISEADLSKMASLPFDEKELTTMGKQWDKEVFRNQKINEWTAFARKNYSELLK